MQSCSLKIGMALSSFLLIDAMSLRCTIGYCLCVQWWVAWFLRRQSVVGSNWTASRRW